MGWFTWVSRVITPCTQFLAARLGYGMRDTPHRWGHVTRVRHRHVEIQITEKPWREPLYESNPRSCQLSGSCCPFNPFAAAIPKARPGGRLGVARRSIPGNAAPWIEAATAQPTRQSSQWLSTAATRNFHSSTVRPRPSVFTRYSAVMCSAKRRCSSGRSPKTERQPRSPIVTAELVANTPRKLRRRVTLGRCHRAIRRLDLPRDRHSGHRAGDSPGLHVAFDERRAGKSAARDRHSDPVCASLPVTDGGLRLAMENEILGQNVVKRQLLAAVQGCAEPVGGLPGSKYLSIEGSRPTAAEVASSACR